MNNESPGTGFEGKKSSCSCGPERLNDRQQSYVNWPEENTANEVNYTFPTVENERLLTAS